MSARQRWSWANDAREAAAFQAEASRIIGEEIGEVRYVTIDYLMEQRGIDAVGPRNVTSDDEWDQPCWVHPTCHTVEFAIEFRTGKGRSFTGSWDLPGTMEGIGIREGPAVGMAVTPIALAAVWDVSTTPQWSSLVGRQVDAIKLRYQPWDGRGAQWCPRIDMVIGGRHLSLLLAEGEYSTDRIVPSADNIAVVFGAEIDLPWLETDAPLP